MKKTQKEGEGGGERWSIVDGAWNTYESIIINDDRKNGGGGGDGRQLKSVTS